MAQKQSALVLSLGGAPETWHRVDGLDGLYHPTIPVPVGGPDRLTVEQAKDLHADQGHPLSVVMVTEAKLEEGRAAQADAMNAGRAAALNARRAGAATPEEQERINDEAAAVSAGKEA